MLDNLNAEQRSAVERTEGPVLVLAGAGTGKTRVITARIAHLLAKKVPASSILAMTFTNKAALEMRERIVRMVGAAKAEELTVGTFHSFCARVLRAYGERIDIPKNFSICDAADQISAVKGALRELSIPEAHLHPVALQSRISLYKNKRISAAEALDRAGDDQDELVARAWRRYDEHLRRARSLDFDDLLLETVRLLEDAELRKAFGKRFRYVLVDEFQDTNAVQFQIVKQIAGAHKNLCVVGDDDQSIYSWRGADVSNILDFERHFPGALVVRLETNYRSTTQILEAANKLIGNNPNRHEKSLRSASGEGERIKGYCIEDETEEADFVVRDIQDLVAAEKAQLGDFAILFRTGTQPRVFEQQLRARGVPYVLVGGMSFFDRKEVRDVLAYLRLLHNPTDEMSFLRILNRPARGIGKTTLDRALAFATEQKISVVEAFERSDEIDKFPSAAREAYAGLRDALRSLGKKDPGKELVKRIEQLIEVVGYRSEVERAYPDPRVREDRWAAVDEVLNIAQNYVAKRKHPKLGAFLEELTLNANDTDDAEKGRERNVVTLMTLHSAKGLEYPRVYLVGMEEGLLPHARSVTEDTVEEERRLAYVGVTRARQVLTLTYAGRRARHGSAFETSPSRFLFEMKGEPPPKGWRACGEAEPAPKKSKKGKQSARARRTARGGVRARGGRA